MADEVIVVTAGDGGDSGDNTGFAAGVAAATAAQAAEEAQEAADAADAAQDRADAALDVASSAVETAWDARHAVEQLGEQVAALAAVVGDLVVARADDDQDDEAGTMSPEPVEHESKPADVDQDEKPKSRWGSDAWFGSR